MTVVSQEEKNTLGGKNRGAHNVSANDFLCLGASLGEESKNGEYWAIVHFLWLLLNT